MLGFGAIGERAIGDLGPAFLPGRTISPAVQIMADGDSMMDQPANNRRLTVPKQIEEAFGGTVFAHHLAKGGSLLSHVWARRADGAALINPKYRENWFLLWMANPYTGPGSVSVEDYIEQALDVIEYYRAAGCRPAYVSMPCRNWGNDATQNAYKDNYNSTMRELCAEKEIVWCDLGPLFTASAASANTEIFKDGTHLNALGIKIAGDRIATALRSYVQVFDARKLDAFLYDARAFLA